MRDVYVLGVGMPKWGELWDQSLRDLFAEAALLALDDAGVDRIDSLVVGCMSSGLFVYQEHLASLMADAIGFGGIPAARVESACASGGLSVRMGALEIMSGQSDLVLAGGVEKMTDVAGDGATFALATAADQEYEVFHGVTFPGLYAMMARAHEARFGTTRDQLAAVAVKNHDNGYKNARAQYRMKLTLDDVKSSTMVADPLRLMDCSPVTDGAACVILGTEEWARKLNKPLVRIKGMGAATASIALHDREDLTTLESTKLAAQRAFKMAGVGPRDIQLCEVHDCFTIAEIMVTEALGFFEPGQGGPAALSGKTALMGAIPVNTSGGLKSKGHPVGATGVAQIVEITEQLRGEAGDRQVKGAKIGMAQNMGGSGGSTVCHILEAL